MNNKVVTRIAPSPTSAYGLHVGNIRTLIFNYLFAKQNNGTFYLRIEDTDQDRFSDNSELLIRQTLDWLGIQPDFAPWTKEQPFGPMRQSERDYTKYIQYLIDNGFVYYAFDTKEELDFLRKEAESKNEVFSYSHFNRLTLKNSLALSKEEVKNLLDAGTPYTLRFKMQPGETITFNDIVRGEVSFDTTKLDDKVLVKTTGMPTYHLANICDDHDMGTTHTMRGEEWLPSTPLHIMLYKAFGWDCPHFAHLPLILNPPPLKGKLSKRNAVKLGLPIFPFGGGSKDGYLKGFVDEGYDKNAVINFLLLHGWTPHDTNKVGEIISLDEAVDLFDINHIHKASAKYDIDKLKFFNGYYLQNKTSDDELMKCVDFGYDIATGFSYNDKLAILDMAKKRSHFKHEMQHVVDIFTKPIVLDDKQKSTITDLHQQVLNTFIAKIWDSEVWDADYIKQAIFDSCETHGLKMGKLMPIMRTILAGGITGPDMVSFMTIIGKWKVIQRITATQPLPTGGLAPDESI